MWIWRIMVAGLAGGTMGVVWTLAVLHMASPQALLLGPMLGGALFLVGAMFWRRYVDRPLARALRRRRVLMHHEAQRGPSRATAQLTDVLVNLTPVIIHGWLWLMLDPRWQTGWV